MSINPNGLQSDWQELYRMAAMETDPLKVPRRISEAREAILTRLQENATLQRDYHQHQELSDAVNGLRLIQQEYFRRIQQYGEPRKIA
jgi:hypothetical protein